MNIVKKITKIFRNQHQKRLNHYQHIEGWLTSSEAAGLAKIASLLGKNAVVVEIGSWKGKSTWCIAHGLKKGVINCIDPFNAAGEASSKALYEKTKGETALIDQFKTNLAEVSSSVSINILQGYSHVFVGTIKNIDFLFIDGDHSIEGCRFDFENYEKELKKGGYLAFHDYYPDREDLGPTWVINNMVKNNPCYSFYEQFDSLRIYIKR